MSDNRRIRLIGLYCTECERVSIKQVQEPLEVDAALHCPYGCGPCGDWNDVEISDEIDRPDVVEQPQTDKYWVKCPHCAVVHADELITWHENGTDYEGIISCPECERPVGGPAGGAWGEVVTAPPPFQRVVNHEPEHARRIEGLERRERMLQAQVVSNNERLNGELADHEELWETLDKRIADLGETVEKQGQWCTVLQARLDASGAINEGLLKRLEKFEAENSVVTGRVVTRDPELANQFAKLQKKIEPLQGWMNEVAEKFKKLEGWRADARVNMLESEVGGAAEERAELSGRVTGTEKQLDLHQESLDGLYQDMAAWTHRLDQLEKHFNAYVVAGGQDHHERLRQVEKRVDLLVNKLPMKGAAAATDHVDAVAQEVRKLNQRVEDLAKTPDLETELRTKLSQHLKQSDSGYEELQRRVSHLEPRVSKLEERRPLFDELVVRVDAAEELWKVAQSRINNAVDVLGGHTLRIQHLEAEASHEEMQKRYKGQEERLHAVEVKVQDMWSDVMGEGEGGDDSNCTMLGIIDGVNTRASAHKALFSQHVERCHDFEVDIRDRIQKLDDRLVDVEPNGEAIETLGAYLDEQLKGLRQDLADLECRAIRVGAVEEAHGALAGQFERLVAKLDQYPEITMEASAKAREVTSRVSKLETMVAEHLLARIEADDKLTGRIDGVELRVANAETIAVGQRKDLDRVEALAKSADEEAFAQGAVEGICERLDKIEPVLKKLEHTLEGVNALVEDVHSSVPSAWAERVDGQGKRLTKVEDRYTELDDRFKELAEDQRRSEQQWEQHIANPGRGDDRTDSTTTA